MPDQLRWSGDAGKLGHCDYDTLLAYIQNKVLEEEARQIRQHLNDCAQCIRCYYDIRLLSDALKPEEQDESLVKSVFMHINNPRFAHLAEQQKRQKRFQEDLLLGRAVVAYGRQKIMGLRQAARRKAARQTTPRSIRSVPLFAFAILLLLTIFLVALVLAYSQSHGSNRSNVQESGLSKSTPQPAFPSQPTAMPTPTPPKNSTPMPGTARQPVISVCKVSANKLPGHVIICGINFTAHDKIQLWIDTQGKLPHVLNLLVNANGQFQYSWTVTQCKDASTTISVYDVSQRSEVGNTLSHIQIGTCRS